MGAEQLEVDDAKFQSHLSRAVKLIGSMLKLFSLEQIALTFNGGKDACVSTTCGILYVKDSTFCSAAKEVQRLTTTGPTPSVQHVCSYNPVLRAFNICSDQ